VEEQALLLHAPHYCSVLHRVCWKGLTLRSTTESMRRCQVSQRLKTRRLTVPGMFDAAAENARSELKPSSRSLAFSGVAGGIALGLGDGSWQQFVSYLMYPAGFYFGGELLVVGASRSDVYFHWLLLQLSATLRRSGYCKR
jgi:hypothetical protein